MLYSIDSDSFIETIPYKADYDRWRARLSENKYEAIRKELHSRISGSEIETSSWIPGSDWTGTVFEPIYHKACQHNKESAAKFFGLILWNVVMEHDECWSFGRYKLGEIPIEGMTYFRINNP